MRRMIECVIALLCGLVAAAALAMWATYPPVQPGPAGAGLATPAASRPPDGALERAICDLARAGGAPHAIGEAGRAPGVRYSVAMAAVQYAADPVEGSRVQLLDTCGRAGA